MKLEAEFEFEVGSFVCMKVDVDREQPDKLQVIGTMVALELGEELKIGYCLRSHSQFNSAVVHAKEGELLAYPSPEWFAERTAQRDVVREEARQAYKAHKAAQAQPPAA